MLQTMLSALNAINDAYWGYIGFVLITAFGLYTTLRSNGFQFKVMRRAGYYLREICAKSDANTRGIHPVRLYFASVGGMVGLGNIVGVTSAIALGGPGSLLWMWIASFLGMIVKYSEIYLGVKFRVPNGHGGYDGGPMYYLYTAFGKRWMSILFCLFMGIYGIEIYQFVVITDTFSSTFALNRWMVVGILLSLVMMATLGGIKRVAHICSLLMPTFMVGYILMCLWVIGHHGSELMSMLPVVLRSAFTGHAAVGGFVGSSVVMAIHYGVQRAVYSGDIGLGYDSIIQSETRFESPAQQARVTIFALMSETVIITMSCLLVLVTGAWNMPGLQPSDMARYALQAYFPYMDIFMAALFFFAGYTTIIGYLAAGQKCALYLHPTYGRVTYLLCAVIAFISFSHFDQTDVMLIMSLAGAGLMTLNLLGIYKLRDEVHFTM